jgi:hypothetical protein
MQLIFNHLEVLTLKIEELKNKEVLGPDGKIIGRIVGVSLSENGTYALEVRGELDEDQRLKALEKFGSVTGTDLFEVPLGATRGIEERVVLKKNIETLLENKEIKVIRRA